MENNELNKFRHAVKGQVKFAEVDSFGVVHNVQYLYMFEWARTEYIKNAGIRQTRTTYIKDFPLMVVHSEIDYFSPATFGDDYEVLTRVAFVKNSSLGFENIARLTDGTILARGKAVMVHLDYKTRQPVRIPDDLRERLKEIEGENVEFLG
jgi:acyl-CoA thioester hydrolase